MPLIHHHFLSPPAPRKLKIENQKLKINTQWLFSAQKWPKTAFQNPKTPKSPQKTANIGFPSNPAPPQKHPQNIHNSSFNLHFQFYNDPENATKVALDRYVFLV
jgi:hypothetical protein